jgi:transcriptional regulator, MarR family
VEKGGGRGADGHSCQTVRDGSDDVGDLRGDGDAKKQRRRPPIGSNPHNGGHGQTEWDSASGVHGGIEARSFDAARAATYTRAAIVTASPAAQASVRTTVSADTTAHARAADRRVQVITLTPKGRELLAESAAAVEELDAELRARLSPAGREALATVLKELRLPE